MRTTTAAVDVAAVWRLTRLVTEDEIVAPIRDAISRRWPDSRLEYLVHCPYCVSVWAGLAVASGLVPRPVRYALALSAGTIAVRTAQSELALRHSARFEEALSGVL